MPAATTADPVHDARQALLKTLDTVEPIVTLSHEDLVVIALRAQPAQPTTDYVTLASADALPTPFEFTELDAGGRVPTVQVKVGLKPLLVIAGETIVGGKQNRVINVSLWLGARKVTPIPVTCLEHGRWNAGHQFHAARPVDLDMRAMLSRQVSANTRRGEQRYDADQGAVWAEIEVKARFARRHSNTSALHDLYNAEALDVGEVVKAFPVPDGASGLAVAVGGKLVALDLFDSPDTLAKQWPRLIESAASAVFDYRRRVGAGALPRPEHRHPDPGALGRMLARAKEATVDAVVNRSAGEGWDVRLATRKLHGAALFNAGRVVHLALFRDEPPPAPPKSPPPGQARNPWDRVSDEPGVPEQDHLAGVPVRGRPR